MLSGVRIEIGDFWFMEEGVLEDELDLLDLLDFARSDRWLGDGILCGGD